MCSCLFTQCHAETDKVDLNAGDGVQEVQWMKIYWDQWQHKVQANATEHQEQENKLEDSAKTGLNDKLTRGSGAGGETLGTGLG